MDIAARFLEYAAAFEETYVDDDWGRLEQYFTEDAVYASTGGPPLGGRWEGRETLIAHLRESVDEFDRRFHDRIVEPTRAPEVGDGEFKLHWRGIYRKDGCPDMVIAGSERAVFDGDRIKLLEDELEEGTDVRVQQYVTQYLT